MDTSTKAVKDLLDSDIADTKDTSMPNQKDITIFLVDDDPIYLKSLELQFLQNPDLKIKSFLSGEACIEQMSIKPDIVILDYMLNGINKEALDGMSTLLAIKNASPGTQVIMLSSAEDVEVVTNSLKLGAFNYVVKNANTFLKLKACIKKILGLYSKEKELIVWNW
jgi:two-component system OmpR family response regulator